MLLWPLLAVLALLVLLLLEALGLDMAAFAAVEAGALLHA
jgi:hypothetical protein